MRRISIHNKMIERRLEVETTAAGDGTTGFYPSSGKVLTAMSDIDHVEVILGKRASGDLNVITCYPSKAKTAATIGATAADEDIAELTLGRHTKVKQVTPIKLTW